MTDFLLTTLPHGCLSISPHHRHIAYKYRHFAYEWQESQLKRPTSANYAAAKPVGFSNCPGAVGSIQQTVTQGEMGGTINTPLHHQLVASNTCVDHRELPRRLVLRIDLVQPAIDFDPVPRLHARVPSASSHFDRVAKDWGSATCWTGSVRSVVL